MCDMNCFNCTNIDCDYEEVTEDERKRQDELDYKITCDHKTGADLSQYKYNHTDKGKEKYRRYAQSDKGKATQQRYAQSDKGKANEKRKSAKKIASGKNAEYCRAYRARKKAEREANNEYL